MAEASRPEKRGPPGPSPLLVIAGLPKVTAEPAAATINNDRDTRWRAVAAAFPNQDAGFYGEAKAIVELGRLACEFAMAGKWDDERVPTPSRIAVAYVDVAGFERLWDVFGHAVLPMPLSHPDWDWPKGRHWRHDIEIVNLMVRRAIAQAEADSAEALRLRLEAHRSDDALLLPGRNFHLNAEDRLVERFRGFMNGYLDVPDIEAGVRVERFAYERLSNFYKQMGGSRKKFAIDARGIVFAKANHGQDGGVHEIPTDAPIDAALLQRALESRYRFGTPLVPDGFQHDAQREKNVPFNGDLFDCVTKGQVPFSGDHVNVFPSDVVTGTQG